MADQHGILLVDAEGLYRTAERVHAAGEKLHRIDVVPATSEGFAVGSRKLELLGVAVGDRLELEAVVVVGEKAQRRLQNLDHLLGAP